MKVKLTQITHQYGVSAYVNKTDDGATRVLYGFVREWWDDLSDDVQQATREGVPPPCRYPGAAVAQQYIDVYFDNHDIDTYEITTPTVGR